MQLSQRAQGWARNASVALVIAMLVVVPLITPPEPWAWKGTKQLLFHVLTLVGLGLALWQSDPSAGKSGWRRLLSGPNLPALLLVLIGGVSLATSGMNRFGSAELLRLVCGVGLYFVVAGLFRARDRMQMMTDALIAVVILATMLGFATYQSGAEERTGFIASFGNRQLIAGFLVLVTPLLLALPLADLTPGRKVAAQVAAVLSCTALLLSQGRSAWIGSLVSLVVLAVMVVKFHDGKKGSLQHIKQAVIVPAVLVVGATGIFLALSRTAPEISSRAATLTAPNADASWVERQLHWSGAMKMIAERPLLGWGIGRYTVESARFVEGSVPAVAVMKNGPSLLEMAHNEYLQIGAEMGLLGLAAYLSLLAAFFVTTVRALGTKRSNLSRVVLMGAIAGVAGQSVDAIANPAWRFADVSLFFWAMLGLGVAAARHGVKEKVTIESTVTRRSFSPMRLGWQGAVTCVFGMLIYQASADTTRGGAPVPAYLRPRSAFVRPPNGIVYGGQTVQMKLVVRYVNGQFVEIVGPCPGLSWQARGSRTGGATNALTEMGTGTGLFQASSDRSMVGKTYYIRGIFTANGATVAATGRMKIPIPFGRTSRVRRLP